MRIDENIFVSDIDDDKQYTVDQFIAVMESHASGGGTRTLMRATYQAKTVSPTVHYTALNTNGSVLTARRTTGVAQANGFYYYEETVIGVDEYIAVWDEGDVDDYFKEWIVVDS